MKFFVPGIQAPHSETAYRALFDAAKDQLRTKITPRRIYRLQYVHDRRPLTVVVGEAHPEHPKYTVLAILESQPHIVMTEGTTGKRGPTIMVAVHEVTEMSEFDAE